MRERLLAALLAGAVLATGCAAPRKEPDRRVPVPDAYRAASEADALASGAARRWWELYRDPALTALIGAALERNRDLSIAVARIEEAEALLGPALYAGLPQVGIGASATRQQQTLRGLFPLPPGARLATIYGTAVSSSFEVDVWGRLRSLENAFRSDLLASRYARETIVITLIGDVAATYFDILALREQLRLTHDTIRTREEFLELTRRRFDAGRASAVEVSRAEGALLGVRARVPPLAQQIGQLENRLAILAGRPLGDAGALVPVDARLPAPPEVPAGLPSALLERRPDLLAATAEMDAASHRARAQRAALFPTIGLTGSIGSTSRELGELFSGPAGTWSFGLSLFAPLLDAGRNKYLVEAQEARERQAVLRYQRTVEAAFREVADALIARSRIAELRATLARQVVALERAARLADQRFRAGLAAYFEVIDAQTELLAARLLENEAQRAQLATLVGLYKSLGGGWDPEAWHDRSTDDPHAPAGR